jgi:hypothetical protein
MNTHAQNPAGNKVQAVANSLSTQQNSIQFADNRPATAAQRKIQETLNNSPQVKQSKAYQDMANNNSTLQRKAASAPQQPVVQRAFMGYAANSTLTNPDNPRVFVPEVAGEEVTGTMRQEILFPIKHLLTNAETRTTANAVNLVGGHLLPVRFGGKGNYPNVQPWLDTFENGAWTNVEAEVNTQIAAWANDGGFDDAKINLRYQVAIDNLDGTEIVNKINRIFTILTALPSGIDAKFTILQEAVEAVKKIPNSVSVTIDLDFIPVNEGDPDGDGGLQLSKKIGPRVFGAAALHNLTEDSIYEFVDYFFARLRNLDEGGIRFLAATPYLDAAEQARLAAALPAAAVAGPAV